jgi:hypothetical protein
MMFQMLGVRDYLQKMQTVLQFDYWSDWNALIDSTAALAAAPGLPPALPDQLKLIRATASNFSDTLTQHVFNHTGLSAQALLSR